MLQGDSSQLRATEVRNWLRSRFWRRGMTHARSITDLPSLIRPSHVRMNSGVLEQSRPTVEEFPRLAICIRRRSRTAVASEYF